MPPEAFTALVEQLVSQKSIDEAAEEIAVTAYFDNRFVIELEKEGSFFKKLWRWTDDDVVFSKA